MAVMTFLLSLSASPGNSQEVIKIAILPIAIHSLENLDPVKEGLMDMLSTRINIVGRIIVIEKIEVKKAIAGVEGEMSLEDAKKIGLKVSADYVLFGSLTKMGESISIDTKLLEMKSGKIVSFIPVQSKGLDGIVPKMDEISQKVHERILGPAAVIVARPQPEKESPPPPPVVRVPEPRPEVAGPKEPEKTTPRIAQDFWMSQALPFEVKGMGIGDIDGDGKNEIVLIDRNNVWIYRWAGELQLIKKVPGHSYHEYLAVDVADVNKNGKAEIFVTSMKKYKPDSFVLEHDRGEFKMIASNLDWYFRIVDLPQQGRTLLGQQSGLENPFYGPIYEMGWDGKQYLRRKKLSYPKNMNIYGLAVVQFNESGPEHYIYLDESQFLTMVSPNGEVLWKSSERFGTNNFIIGKPKITTSWVQESDWIPVNLRILIDGQGKKEIVLPYNSSLTGQFIKRVKFYNKGEIQRFSWNGTVLEVSWRSKEIGGYIADCQMEDVDGDQKKELVGALALWGEPSLTRPSRSAIVVSKQ